MQVLPFRRSHATYPWLACTERVTTRSDQGCRIGGRTEPEQGPLTTHKSQASEPPMRPLDPWRALAVSEE
jgi:hypothetical protein